MVPHLIRLRYVLMWNSFRRSVGTMIGAIFSALGFLYFIVMAYILASVAAFAPPEEVTYTDRGAVFVLCGAVTVLVWIIGPIVFSTSNPFTNPQNFLVFGIPNKTFIPGVVLGGVVAPTGLGTLILFLTGSVLWGWHPAAIVAGVLAALIGTVLCVIIMQVIVGALNNLISRRAVRDAMQLIVLVPLMLAGFILMGAIETIQEFWELLPQVATWIAFTPAGFLSLPWFVAQAQWGMAALHLVVMLAYIGLAAWAYNAIVNCATEAAGTMRERQREPAGIGLLGRANSPMQAIWARSLLYWFKDPRYAASLILVAVFVLFGIFEITILKSQDFSLIPKILPALIAYLLAFSISADLSYDSTGFSLHITTGVRGIDDRLGRVFGLLTWALPLTLLLTIAMVFATDASHEFAAWLGLSIGVLLSGTGLSAVISARYIYPVPPPGTSLMAQPEGGMGRIMLVQTVGMLMQFFIALPVVIPAVVALIVGSPAWGIITLMIGVLYGAGMLWAGVRIGAKWYERALPETYQSIVKVAALY
ncbi:hypothetical protein [Enteractinococcus coprophilus]|uniref:ABC-2 type transport system permease protein n=1 Tax=Enteractinococcus coprophilus TaxID=1027633 RepID=A0A543AIF1_9MICC|nr:hypothetical protein [Enteractinococcus coprophilus]TQL72349.1 ABC-2 type transport system permease protein [Enteractinococcus coprophilus]